MRKLKLWNGRFGRRGHAYVCAYSQNDARALIKELFGYDPGRAEIVNYWNPGCWGRSMDGITPERGVWVARDDFARRSAPVRATPENARELMHY